MVTFIFFFKFDFGVFSFMGLCYLTFICTFVFCYFFNGSNQARPNNSPICLFLGIILIWILYLSKSFVLEGCVSVVYDDTDAPFKYAASLTFIVQFYYSNVRNWFIGTLICLPTLVEVVWLHMKIIYIVTIGKVEVISKVAIKY